MQCIAKNQMHAIMMLTVISSIIIGEKMGLKQFYYSRTSWFLTAYFALSFTLFTSCALGMNTKSAEEIEWSKYMTLRLQQFCAGGLEARDLQIILDRHEDQRKQSSMVYLATGLLILSWELIRRGVGIKTEEPSEVELCSRLVRLGAQVNPKLEDKYEFTSRPPIWWVASHGRVALCQALIDAGAQFHDGQVMDDQDRLVTAKLP